MSLKISPSRPHRTAAMSTPTLVRPTHPDSLPNKVYSLKQGNNFFGTRRYVQRGGGVTKSHIVVFQKEKDARAMQKLFMEHSSNLENWPTEMDDSWQMQIQTCGCPAAVKLDVHQEELVDLMQLGLFDICINIVCDMRFRGNATPGTSKETGYLEFLVRRTIHPEFDMHNIRQHYNDMWDRMV